MTLKDRRQKIILKRRVRNKIHNSVLMFITILMAGVFISCLCVEPTTNALPFFCMSVIWLGLICLANGYSGFQGGEEE